jgi:ribose transport system ATP-binding protein
LGKRFGSTIALDGVDLSVEAGQVLAVVGENGAGKSTLMKILSGAYQPDRGEIWLDGEPYAPASPAEGRRRGVAMIYQELSLAPDLSVMENVLLGMEPRRGPFVKWPEMRRRTRAALDALGRSDISPDQRVSELSVADRQLVEIARAVAVGCRVLVLDEPTSSLGANDIKRLFALVNRLKRENHAIIYISHFLEEVRAISDRFIVLRDGKTAGEGITAHTPASRFVEMMVGRPMTDLYPRSPHEPSEAVLEISHVAGKKSPLDASLTLHRGEVLGIAGLVGAGRTELLRIIFGLDPIRSGAVRLGILSDQGNPAHRWAQGMGLVSEDRKLEGLALSLSIAANLTMPCTKGMGPWGLSLPSREQHAAEHWIKQLSIRCQHPEQPVTALSGGNQQKVAIARLLLHGCDILLLDEPTPSIA